VEGTAQTSDAVETISNMTLCAGGMRSRFDRALSKLKAGRTDGRMTEVIDGLKTGDEVLMHPPDNVKDGTEVVKREEPK